MRFAFSALLLGAAGVVQCAPILGSEVIVPVPGADRITSVALSTRGSSAFRVRFIFAKYDDIKVDTPMVAPDKADAPFAPASVSSGSGITSPSIGTVYLSTAGELTLLDPAGAVITKSAPLGGNTPNNTCASQPGTDITGGTRAGDPTTVSDEAACCAACAAVSGCKNWIYGHPGDAEGNCWLMSSISGSRPAADRTLGGAGSGNSLRFSAATGTKLYGRGAGKGDAKQLTATSVSPFVDNTVVYAPHYYSTDGYACLGVVNSTTGSGKSNRFPASYSLSGDSVSWNYAEGPFEVYLMPAPTLDRGTSALLQLTGAPAIPPRYAFGFIASRWGWENRSYIESVLHNFRDGHYPIDAFIGDFGWFTDVSDYNFPPQGMPDYFDFGYNPATFPDPASQLKSYRDDLHFRMGGIRKPRLGNTDLLNEARGLGYLLPGGEMELPRGSARAPSGSRLWEEGVGYAEQRNINYSIPAARDWYAKKQSHYLEEGVSFFWNDEGETDYFTFHWWNVAQAASQKIVDANKRFYSINRAWSPGMARLGATVWTGDINPSWDDLQSTPGMVLNWGLAAAPYVACDIGGFTGESSADLLARWLQVGTFMPTMRVHSTKSATPHFPWLWPEPFRSAMKGALELRYRLLPYHYSLAHRMYSEAALWMRPMVAEFPTDPAAADITSQWLDGAILVAPVLSQDSQKNIYLPAGTWYEFNSSTTHAGPTTLTGDADVDEVPAFVREGAVIALAPVLQYTDALPGGALQIQVYSGADGGFSLVEDDGETLGYTKGEVRTTSFEWHDSSKLLTWDVRGSASSAQMFSEVYLTLFSPSGQSDSKVVTLGTSGSISAALAPVATVSVY